MLRRQISAITAWQVSTLTGLALLAGLPLGIAAGRWSWALFAHGLGIPRGAITPILAGPAHGARSDRHRQRGGVLAGPDNRAAEPGGRTARRVAQQSGISGPGR